MCDWYLITVRDGGNIIAGDQFGPDSENHVPKVAGCTCGMWRSQSDETRQAFLALVARYLREMPYGTLTIERLP